MTTTPTINSIFSYNRHLDSYNLIQSIAVALVGRNDFTSYCINNAIKQDQPNRVIIATLQDMIKDNGPVLAGLLGEELMEKIKMFEI